MLPTTLAMIILKPVACVSYFVFCSLADRRYVNLEIKVRRSFLFTTYMAIRIYDSDNRTIRWRVFTFERKTRFLSPAPKNQLTDAGARRIDGHQRFSLRF